MLLLLHIVSSLGFLGAVAGFFAMAIVGITATDESVVRGIYVAMAIVTWEVIVPLATASLLIGVVQALLTPWGLFRHYWVVIKLVLTVLAYAVLLVRTSTVNDLANVAMSGPVTAMGQAKMTLLVHSGGGLIVLLVVTVLSVYKPRGLTGYGASLPGRASAP